MNKLYITTPLYYVNASPHIGHAYTNVICDCMARYKRLKGEEVFFLTGTDEHGEKIKEAAEQKGEDVKQFVDRGVDQFKSLWEALQITYDSFIRTTDDYHVQVVQHVISTLHEKGDIYKAPYRGFYCMPCETFFTETQIKEAEGKCPDCGREVEEVVEENYFFKLSKYEPWLKEHLRQNPDCIKPIIRFNEVMGFLEHNPLEDLCISRPKKRVSWGIEFPLDDAYVIYVWFDALLNYISGAGFSIDEDRFKHWWPADFQFIGKDILRHHAIFWPIMLKALDIEPPRVVFAHGWWKVNEAKMSKSLGNIVNPFELIDQIGVDAVRYFLLREVSIGMDGNFSWRAIVTRVNSDLANDLGNLVYRTLNMAEKYFQGDITPVSTEMPAPFIQAYQAIEANYISCMDKAEFPQALELIFKLLGVMNKYIEDSKPWTLWKEKDIDALQNLLYVLIEGIRICAFYLSPFLPISVQQIYKQLNIEYTGIDFTHKKWARFSSYSITKGDPLFPRIDVD